MFIKIKGVDIFTGSKVERFEIIVNLTKDDISINHQKNCVKICVNGDEYFVSTIEDFVVNV